MRSSEVKAKSQTETLLTDLTWTEGLKKNKLLGSKDSKTKVFLPGPLWDSRNSVIDQQVDQTRKKQYDTMVTLFGF